MSSGSTKNTYNCTLFAFPDLQVFYEKAFIILRIWRKAVVKKSKGLFGFSKLTVFKQITSNLKKETDK